MDTEIALTSGGLKYIPLLLALFLFLRESPYQYTPWTIYLKLRTDAGIVFHCVCLLPGQGEVYVWG